MSLAVALGKLAAAGWQPGTIIDVGVAIGTEGLYDVWPSAPIVLVDPVPENLQFMEKIARDYADVRIVPVAAGEKCGQTVAIVHRASGLSLVGKSKSSADWETTTFDMLTLDAIVERARASAPYLIKIDTDAKELAILSGAAGALKHTDVVCIELKIFSCIHQRDTPAAIFHALDALGFSFAEIAEVTRYPADGFLRIVDFVFVRTESQLFADLYRLSRKPDKLWKRARDRQAALKTDC